MSFVGGKLILKNSAKREDKPGERKHKIEKKDHEPPAKSAKKGPTKAELEVQKRREAKLAEEIKREIAMPHRERIKKYNNYLEGLPTLFDLPRTGTG